MEQSNRKIKSSIISIISIILMIPLLIFTIYNALKYSDYKNKKNDLNKTIEEEEKKLSYAKEDQNKILNDLNYLKNIDENIEKKKEKTFELAKEVEQKIIDKETNYKIAYITFDDGPYYLTYSVIDVLKEKKVKATFFTIGQGKETCFDNKKADCTKLYKEIVDNGHTIANHTYSHAIFNGLYSSSTSFMNQIIKQEENIKEKTGVTTNIIRFPGGSATAGNLKNGIITKLRERGYGWVDWTAQDGDGGSLETKSQAWSNFTGSINEDIEVVLFHDYNNITYSILSDAIDYLEGKNYIILPLFYESVKVNK